MNIDDEMLKEIFQRICAIENGNYDVRAKLTKAVEDAVNKMKEVKKQDKQKESVSSVFRGTDKPQKAENLSYYKVLEAIDSAKFAVHRLAFLRQEESDELKVFVKEHEGKTLFADAVYKIMDNHNLTAPQVYKNAIMSRQEFGRLTGPYGAGVTRKKAWQIIIGLHCTLQEADEILHSAGYVRENTRLDLTMQYFIENKNYDILAIDIVLNEFNMKTFVKAD